MINLFTHTRTPKLTLVGAGPGALDLITLRGITALNTADVVLYDALVDKRMLKHAKRAKKIFVGKRKGYKRFFQEEINELIVKSALEYGSVVRLKGGDSFVFGRGTEEIQYAEAFNIETEVVPGITSAIAAPASAGIPMTHRNVSRSFWALTGTSSHNVLNEDIHLAAKSSATVVILMGMSKLDQIVEIFTRNGKEDTPVSIIQNGTTHKEKIGVGTVQSIREEVKNRGLSSPAIIIIGEVVKESSRFSQFFSEKNTFQNQKK